jgi:hypothetical protein
MAGAVRDIRAQKLLAMRGVIVGFAFLFLFQRFVMEPLSRLDYWLFVTGLADVRSAWPNHHFLLGALAGVGGVCSGWTVVRWHRISTVFLLVASVLVFNVLWSWLVVVPALRSVSVYGWSLTGVLTDILMVFIIVPTTILLGGLWGASEDNGNVQKPDDRLARRRT